MSDLNEHEIAIVLGESKILDYELRDDGFWYGLVDDGTVERDWRPVLCHSVPLKYLLEGYHCFLLELSNKEVEYMKLKEEFNRREFEIVYLSDFDFKKLYGSTAEKVRKQHAIKELKPLKDELNGLELSIDYLKRYIVFIRELIRTKRVIMEVSKYD